MILATEAAKLAAQLGIPTAELAMSPATIPLLSTNLSDVPDLPAPVAAPKPNQTLQSNNRAAKGDSISAFQSLASFRQQSTQSPEQLSMVPHQAFGPAFGADMGIPPIGNRSVSSALSLPSFQPVMTLSNALLIAAKAEVDLMMTHMAAQSEADYSIQAQSAARLPLPIAPPFTVPTFPLMMPAWNASMTPMQGAQALALASMGNRPTPNRGIQNDAASVATRSKLQ